MCDFTGGKTIEPIYSYNTVKKAQRHGDMLGEWLISGDTLLDADPCPILIGCAPAHNHRFLLGFFPIENGSHRWMGKSGVVLVDVPASARHFFIEGFLPNLLLSGDNFSISVHIEGRYLGDIHLYSPGSFSCRLPLCVDHISAPRRLVRFDLKTSRSFIPSKVDESSQDFRELSVLITRMGVADSTEIPKTTPSPDQRNRRQAFHPYFDGKCIVCGSDTRFVLEDISSVRETLVCGNCHSSNRARQLARGLLKFLRQRGFQAATVDDLSRELTGQEISIYDTDSNSSICHRLRVNPQYITSDYLPGIPLGSRLAERHYCQDLSSLTFADDSFDVVLSSDVLEHVRLYQHALGEAFRVLKPGGAFIFNVPFISSNDDHDIYVNIVEADDPVKDQPTRPAVYHGDTLSEAGSLLYRIYGRKLFHDLESVGFLVSYERVSLPKLGIYDCELFVCMKPASMCLGHNFPTSLYSNQRVSDLSVAGSVYDCKWLNIEFSSVCNLRCRWCVLDHKKPAQFLSLERFEFLLKQIANGELPALERIDLHNGGEALLHPRVDEMLSCLARYRPRFKQPIHVALLSNGTVIQESTLSLLVSGTTVDEIRISIDGGTPAEFEKIRRGANWHTVAKNTLRVLEGIAIANSSTTIGIICMVSSKRETDVSWMDPEFRAVIERAHHLEIRHPHTWDGSILNLRNLRPDPVRKRRGRICKFLKHNLVVLANGDATVCCADLNGRGVIGHIDERTLVDLYRGDSRKRIIELWAAGRFAEIDACSTCEGYYDSDIEDSIIGPLHGAADPSDGPSGFGEAMALYRDIHRRFSETGNKDTLAAELVQFISRYPGIAAAHNDLGVIALQNGETARARDHYKTAVRCDPANGTAMKNLADLYFVVDKQAEQARDLYLCILADQPSDLEALIAMGHVSRYLGCMTEAAGYFRRALELSPEYEHAAEIINAISPHDPHPSPANSV